MIFRQNADNICKKRDPGLVGHPGSHNLYTMEEDTPPPTKIQKNNQSPLITNHFINQSSDSHPPCLADRPEFLPGVPVNRDHHLHPLLFREGRFTTTPRSCPSPCFFLYHNQNALSNIDAPSIAHWKCLFSLIFIASYFVNVNANNLSRLIKPACASLWQLGQSSMRFPSSLLPPSQTGMM